MQEKNRLHHFLATFSRTAELLISLFQYEMWNTYDTKKVFSFVLTGM